MNLQYSKLDLHSTLVGVDSSALRTLMVQAAADVTPGLALAFRTKTAAESKSSHHDLVTAYDTTVEHTLRTTLLQVENSEFWGEETGGTTSTDGLCWLVDPIDGTSNFAQGFPMFSVSIAALVDGETRAGVVADPLNGVFSADAAGAYLNERPLKTKPQTGAQNILTSFPWAEHLTGNQSKDALALFADMVRHFSTLRRTVSGALELCFAAAGWADVVLNASAKPWDIAAAGFILQQAGGIYRATGKDSGEYLGVAPGRNAQVAEEFYARLIQHFGHLESAETLSPKSK